MVMPPAPTDSPCASSDTWTVPALLPPICRLSVQTRVPFDVEAPDGGVPLMLTTLLPSTRPTAAETPDGPTPEPVNPTLLPPIVRVPPPPAPTWSVPLLVQLVTGVSLAPVRATGCTVTLPDPIEASVSVRTPPTTSVPAVTDTAPTTLTVPFSVTASPEAIEAAAPSPLTT